jgi:hypothetical protein
MGNPMPDFEKKNGTNPVDKLNFTATNKNAYEIMEDQYKSESIQGSWLQVRVEGEESLEAGGFDQKLVFENVAFNAYDIMQEKYFENASDGSLLEVAVIDEKLVFENVSRNAYDIMQDKYNGDPSDGSLLEIAVMEEKLVFENTASNAYEVMEQGYLGDSSHGSLLEVAVMKEKLVFENTASNAYEVMEQGYLGDSSHGSLLEVAVMEEKLLFENVAANACEIMQEKYLEDSSNGSSLEVAVLPEGLMEEVTNILKVEPPKVPRINIDTPREANTPSNEPQVSPYDKFEASLQAQRLAQPPTQAKQAAHEQKFGYHHQATLPTTHPAPPNDLPDHLSNHSLPAPRSEPDDIRQLYYKLQEESPNHPKELEPAQEAYLDFQKNLWGPDSKRVTGNQLAAFHPKSLNGDEFYTCLSSEKNGEDSRRIGSPNGMEVIPESEKMIRGVGSGSVKNLGNPFGDDGDKPVYQQDGETEELREGKGRLRSKSHRDGDSGYGSKEANLGSNGGNLLTSPMVGIDNFISFSNDGARIQTSNHEFVVFETEKNLTDSKRLESIGSMEKKHQPTLYNEKPQSLDSKFDQKSGLPPPSPGRAPANIPPPPMLLSAQQTSPLMQDQVHDHARTTRKINKILAKKDQLSGFLSENEKQIKKLESDLKFITNEKTAFNGFIQVYNFEILTLHTLLDTQNASQQDLMDEVCRLHETKSLLSEDYIQKLYDSNTKVRSKSEILGNLPQHNAQKKQINDLHLAESVLQLEDVTNQITEASHLLMESGD